MNTTHTPPYTRGGGYILKNWLLALPRVNLGSVAAKVEHFVGKFSIGSCFG